MRIAGAGRPACYRGTAWIHRASIESLLNDSVKRRRWVVPSPTRSRLLPTSVTLLSGRTLATASFGWGGVGGGGRAMRHTCAITPRPPTPTLPHKGGGRRSKARSRPTIPVDFQRVALDHRQPSRIMRRDLAERRDGAAVAFDGDHVPCALRQQCAGEPARPRADLHDRDAFERAARPGDARRQVEVEEEILSERFLR